jgi:hypothetical protein
MQRNPDPHNRIELPVACALGPNDGAARMARWERLAQRAAPSAQRLGRELEVSYAAASGVREELEALAAAEAECCAFVTWTVAQDGERVVLRVTADPQRPDDVAPIAALVGAP